MSRMKNYFLRFFEGGEGGGGSDIGQEAELYAAQQQQTQENYQQPSESEVNDNPAWKDILDPVPGEFHEHLKGHLSKSDKYLQQVQQQYAPYKEFADQGVSREQLQQSIQLAQIFQNNPRGVFDYLNNTYNFIPSQGQPNSQGQQQENLELGQPNEPEFDLSKDPRFQQVANQAQLAEQMAVQLQQERINAQVDTQISSEMQQLDKEFPGIPKAMVVKLALGNAAAKGPNVAADLIGAAREIQQMGLFRGSKPAPPNISGRGNAGLPSSQVDPAKMSRSERNAYVAEQLRLAAEG